MCSALELYPWDFFKQSYFKIHIFNKYVSNAHKIQGIFLHQKTSIYQVYQLIMQVFFNR